ncbi:MAG: TIGR00282 family metallophosphoesterase [Chloroflexi bacterium]|nr:TIGR00282 family metallophosphoesterase [Chloroflexota bacterium]
MKVIFIGDIVGSPGRQAVSKLLSKLKRQFKPDYVIANAENCAGGRGITPDTAQELLQYGIDVLTSGNHIWAQKDIIEQMNGTLPLIRPLNYPPGVPGKGYIILGDIMVVNLMGRVFIANLDCPFRAMDALLEKIKDRPKVVIVDFHAEATSEKVAMGHYLDGRVNAVIGTHTHVATADNRILSKGTAYITDAGMTGPIDSVIGDDKEAVINRFLTAMISRLPVAKGKTMFNAVLIELNEDNGKATSIERIYEEVD